jgi:hypothetical protein
VLQPKIGMGRTGSRRESRVSLPFSSLGRGGANLPAAQRGVFSSATTHPAGSSSSSRDADELPHQVKKKMTLGWVVNGGRRHAELQEDLIPRGYWVE